MTIVSKKHQGKNARKANNEGMINYVDKTQFLF